VLQTVKTGAVAGVCKARQQVFSVGNGVSLFGKIVAEGKFSCVKFFEENGMLCVGDREGNIHIAKGM
jgi:hypothetical protein